MIELKDSELLFTCRQVHHRARLSIDFQRTLRIPDDENSHPLPPGLGRFPLRLVDDYEQTVPERWSEDGGVMLPMYQSEALWVNFDSDHIHRHHTCYPFSVKIATGTINAVTGELCREDLASDPQDYVSVPPQPWLDGYNVDEDHIRQFVAMPLGEGYTAEEQIKGRAEKGGLQISVYPMKRDVFDREFPPDSLRSILWEWSCRAAKVLLSAYALLSALLFNVDLALALLGEPSLVRGTVSRSALWLILGGVVVLVVLLVRTVVQSLGRGVGVEEEFEVLGEMGLAPGGRMRQEVYADPYGPEAWDMEHGIHCFVHLANSQDWQRITGARPPDAPPSAKDYTEAGLPWFEYYDEGAEALEGSQILAGLKSVGELDQEESQPASSPNRIVLLRPARRRKVREASAAGSHRCPG